MSVYSEQESYFPNLPGYRSKSSSLGGKRSILKKVDGEAVVTDDILPNIGRSQDYSDAYTQNATSLVSSTSSLMPRPKMRINPQTIGVVLSFHAFFEEDVMYSALTSEGKRIRVCNINYYAETGLISVIEKQQLNSGIPQGVLVKKDVIYKRDNSPVTAEDLIPGNTVEIYKRPYHIVGCDENTKRFLRKYYRIENVPHYDMPYDAYSASRSEHSEAQTWERFRTKKNETKEFVEARLGNFVDNSGREGFIRYGNQKLQFRCIWDNTSNLYGDVSEYCLVYHLSDDTVEIFSINPPNSGREMFSRLLRRSKLPKSISSSSSNNIGINKADEFFSWKDLNVGMELNVYARNLFIIDADEYTREFYTSRGLYLNSAQAAENDGLVIRRERELPPPTGFGSDEDSLRSCFGSLQIQPPHFKKLGENKVLSFTATMCSGGPDDFDRNFVVMFYVQDGTLKIMEPPVRNSGFIGGTFLSRRAVKLSNGEPLKEHHLYVGAKVNVLNNVFWLKETNISTLHWMEEKGLPKSNIYAIINKIRQTLIDDALNGILESKFRRFNSGQGITVDALRAVIDSYGLLKKDDDEYDEYDEGRLVEHEIITLFRAEGNRSKYLDYHVFKNMLTQDFGYSN